MNAGIFVCVAALAVCSSGQLLGYPGLYQYPGVLGAYQPTFLHHAAPLTYTNVLHTPVAFKTVASAPITFKSAAPVKLQTVAPTPVTVKTVAPFAYNLAPVTPVQSQYHAQDELGRYSFGYSGGPSSRAETRDALGVVRGSYNYVDPEGQVQTQHYVADAGGFRVAGTDLPVAPDGSEAVQDTQEVASQKATLKAAQEEAAATAAATPESRKKRSVVAAPAFYPSLRFAYGFHTPLHYSHPAITPYYFPHNTVAPPAYSFAAPAVTTYHGVPAATTYHGVPVATTYTAAAPAVVRDAELLKVVHNPGHATSYRVD